VATVGVDNGANAAYLACQILSIKYDELKQKLAAFRVKMKADFVRDNPPLLAALDDGPVV
jgi:5-(carboxyamino)imidazole ribonucleotide mutase